MMVSSTLRKRLHHGDIDGRKREYYDSAEVDSLGQPLLGNETTRVVPERAPVLEDLWDNERRKQQLHWTLLFSQLLAQWAQWLANIVISTGSFLGRLLPLPYAFQNGSSNRILSLSPLQEARLRYLKQRLGVPFDGSRLEHQDALKQLWRLAYPDREMPPLKSELWKEMGWQGSDPSTDFRGGGFISLENLIFFAKNYPDSFSRLLHKKDGQRAEWEYPFAVAGINISFMLAQMLDLQTGTPSTSAGARFLELLAADEMAFDKLYCVAFRLLDGQWLAARASYMQFNDVLKSTRLQLERELALDDVHSVTDLPAYNLMTV